MQKYGLIHKKIKKMQVLPFRQAMHLIRPLLTLVALFIVLLTLPIIAKATCIPAYTGMNFVDTVVINVGETCRVDGEILRLFDDGIHAGWTRNIIVNGTLVLNNTELTTSVQGTTQFIIAGSLYLANGSLIQTDSPSSPGDLGNISLNFLSGSQIVFDDSEIRDLSYFNVASDSVQMRNFTINRSIVGPSFDRVDNISMNKVIFFTEYPLSLIESHNLNITDSIFFGTNASLYPSPSRELSE